MNTHDSEPVQRFEEVLQRVFERLSSDMGSKKFAYWILPLRFRGVDEERIVITCRTPIIRDLTVARFGKKITDAIAAFMPKLKSVDFVADPLKPSTQNAPALLKLDGTVLAVAGSACENKSPDAELKSAEEASEKLLSKLRIKIEDIKRYVAEDFQSTVADLESQSRKREIVRQRHFAIYLARRLSGRSYPEISRRFGGRDHTTALYGCNKVEKQMKLNAAVAAEVERLTLMVLAKAERERN